MFIVRFDLLFEMIDPKQFLRNLSYKKMQDFTNRHAGQTRKVLLEGHVTTSMMEGYSDNYIKVTTPYREEWANSIVDWTL